jgi:hypothetical protein
MISNKFFLLVKSYLDNDPVKTWKWLQTPNTELYGFSPIEMLKQGRKRKLMGFIENTIAKKGYLP